MLFQIKKNVSFAVKRVTRKINFLKKYKLGLAALFIEELDPSWWDLALCEARDDPEREIVFLPYEETIDSASAPSLNKKIYDTSSKSSSFDSDGDANFGGV